MTNPLPTLITTIAKSRAGGKLERFTFINCHAYVHNNKVCKGEYCVIHNPSKHNMLHMPILLRETALVERICEHSIGHPDPDSRAWLDREGPVGSRGTWGTHGCDGCCTKNYDD